MNQADLAAVAGCYYVKGAAFDPTGRWAFVSRATAAETTREAWEAGHKLRAADAYCLHASVAVLGEENRAGTSYGRVSVGESYPGLRCTRAKTYTWIMEDGKWRRLALPKTSELARRKLAEGDYAAARAAAEGWLAKDPFSTEAYSRQLLAIVRGGGTVLDLARTREDVLRALLSIDARASDTLFYTASLADGIDVAESFLDKLAPDDCDRAGAVFNVALKIASPAKRLAFLDRHPTETPATSMLRIESLAKARRYAELSALFTAALSDSIRAHLDSNDSGFAAGWAAVIGKAALSVKNAALAKEWVDYGLGRDPVRPELITLLKALKPFLATSPSSPADAPPLTSPKGARATVRPATKAGTSPDSEPGDDDVIED